MKRLDIHIGFLLAFATLLITSPSLCAKKLRPLVYSPLQQAMHADLIAVGTMTAQEPELFEATVDSDGTKDYYLIAVVKISERFFGPKGLTHIRVGIPLNDRSNGCASLELGREACLFLVKDNKFDFYSPFPNSTLLELSNPTYQEEVRRVKKAVSVLEKPIESLKAKDSADRRFAAGILLSREQVAPQMLGNGKQKRRIKTEPISEEESKLILAALGEMTWGDVGIEGEGLLTVQSLFWQLGLSEKDGWHQPVVKENQDYNTVMDGAVKKWIKEHGSKYRIQRNVLERSNSFQ